MSVERILSLAGLMILAGMAVAVSLWKPGESAFLPPCPFHALTGLHCPGCGSTRMMYHLVHGRPWQAFQQNPLAFVCLPFVVTKLAASACALRLPVPGAAVRLMTAWSYPATLAFFAVVVAFTVARNIPIGPYCNLAPGGC
jgi:hypothetical protein